MVVSGLYKHFIFLPLFLRTMPPGFLLSGRFPFDGSCNWDSGPTPLHILSISPSLLKRHFFRMQWTRSRLYLRITRFVSNTVPSGDNSPSRLPFFLPVSFPTTYAPWCGKNKTLVPFNTEVLFPFFNQAEDEKKLNLRLQGDQISLFPLMILYSSPEPHVECTDAIACHCAPTQTDGACENASLSLLNVFDIKYLFAVWMKSRT